MAEEVSQDAFMSVWRQAATYRAGGPRPAMAAGHRPPSCDRPAPPSHRDRQPADARRSVDGAVDRSDVFADAYRGIQREQIRRALASCLRNNARRSSSSTSAATPSTRGRIDRGASGTVKSRVRLGIAKLKYLLDAELT